MKLKTILAFSLSLLGTYQVAKLHSRYRHPLVRQSHRERLLEAVDTDREINWLTEDAFEEGWHEHLTPYLDERRQAGFIQTELGQLAYEYYSIDQAQATCIIVHGYNEFKEKYRELVYYLLQAGIQVFAYDGRGHGDSRINKQETQINILDFRDYVADLETVLTYVERKNAPQHRVFLFGHSMGGAVVTHMAQVFPDRLSGLILSAPMLAVKTRNIPTEWAHIYASLMQKLGRGRDYLPEKTDPASTQHLVYQSPNHLADSDVRGSFFFHLNYQLHQYPTHSGSFNWLKAALDYLQLIQSPRRIANMTLPVLMFRSGQDQLVPKEGLFNMQVNLKDSLNFVIPDSQHEILSGHDEQVKAIVSQIIHFINRAE